MWQQRFLKGFAGDQGQAHEAACAVATEAITSIRTVAAFSLQDTVQERFLARLAAPLRRALVRGQVAGAVFGFSQVPFPASWHLVTHLLIVWKILVSCLVFSHNVHALALVAHTYPLQLCNVLLWRVRYCTLLH